MAHRDTVLDTLDRIEARDVKRSNEDPEAEKLNFEASKKDIKFWNNYFQKKEPTGCDSRLIHR